VASRAASDERKRRADEEKRALGDKAPAPPAPIDPPALGAERARGGGGARGVIEAVGFKQLPNASRVFVRTAGAVAYAVHGEPGAVVLELRDTRIGRRNNRRILDTHFFDTPIAQVVPRVVGDAVRIEIKLKEQVPYAARQEGGDIYVEFQRP
jgi:hypothetical protein